MKAQIYLVHHTFGPMRLPMSNVVIAHSPEGARDVIKNEPFRAKLLRDPVLIGVLWEGLDDTPRVVR